MDTNDNTPAVLQDINAKFDALLEIIIPLQQDVAILKEDIAAMQQDISAINAVVRLHNERLHILETPETLH